MAKRRTAKKKTRGGARTSGVVVEVPGITDVLFGRGGHVNHNPANQRYLELVNQRKEEYQHCPKSEKANIAWDIMRELRQQDPPTKFLKKDYSSNHWHVVEDADVRRKISQCLRERSTPVCPTAKGKQNNDKAPVLVIVPPRLRWSMRTSRRRAQAIDDDNDEWLPEGEERERYSSRGSVTVEEEEESFATKGYTSEQEEAPGVPSSTVENTGSQAGRLHEPEERVGTDLHSVEPVSSSQQAYVPPPPEVLVTTSIKQLPAETTVVSSNEAFGPPPIPAPISLKQEGSNRVLSDFLTRSFASFAPSIFECSSGAAENAWENLLDPSILPELATSEDDDSFPGNDEINVAVPKRSYSQTSNYPRVDCLSPAKRRKTESDDMDPDSFLNSAATLVVEQVMNLTPAEIP